MADEHLTSCAAEPAGWYRLLAAAAANAGHGFFNAALIDAQQPDAGPAAIHDDWRAAGWQARKGQDPGVWIIKEHDDRTEAIAVLTQDQVRPSRPGARPPLPGTVRISAGSPDQALRLLVALARLRGYTVTRPEGTDGGPATDWDQHSITIPAREPPAGAAAALAHQIAHIIREDELAAALLPGVEPAPGDRPHQPGTTGDCYGVAAVEADSAAWLALTRLGVDPVAARIIFPAARTWAGPDPRGPSARAIAAVGERIAATAAAITAHAEKALADLPDPPPAPVPAPAAEPPAHSPPAQSPQVAAARHAIVTDRPAWPYPDQALVRVNAEAAAYFRSRLRKGGWAAAYLRRRGFGPDICRRYQLGYAPRAWTRLLDHLRAKGYPDELLEAAGLVRRTRNGNLIDVFRDRVMFPIRGVHGQIVAFAGRAPDDAEEGTPKYLNTKGTAIWHKDHELYGLAEAAAALQAGARPVLVEGYTDRIAVCEAGRFLAASGAGMRAGLAGLAPGGTALSIHQMELLAATVQGTASDLRQGRPLLVALDPDPAGRKAALRDFRLICLYSPGATTPALPEGADPADIFERGGARAVAAALTAGERPLADLAVDAVLEPWQEKLDKGWAEGQMGAVRDAAQLLAEAKPADPGHQVARVAERTGIPYDDVARQVLAALKTVKPYPKGDDDPDRQRTVAGGSLEYPAPPAPAPPRTGPSGTPGPVVPRPRRPPPHPPRPAPGSQILLKAVTGVGGISRVSPDPAGSRWSRPVSRILDGRVVAGQAQRERRSQAAPVRFGGRAAGNRRPARQARPPCRNQRPLAAVRCRGWARG